MGIVIAVIALFIFGISSMAESGTGKIREQERQDVKRGTYYWYERYEGGDFWHSEHLFPEEKKWQTLNEVAEELSDTVYWCYTAEELDKFLEEEFRKQQDGTLEKLKFYDSERDSYFIWVRLVEDVIFARRGKVSRVAANFGYHAFDHTRKDGNIRQWEYAYMIQSILRRHGADVELCFFRCPDYTTSGGNYVFKGSPAAGQIGAEEWHYTENRYLKKLPEDGNYQKILYYREKPKDMIEDWHIREYQRLRREKDLKKLPRASEIKQDWTGGEWSSFSIKGE